MNLDSPILSEYANETDLLDARRNLHKFDKPPVIRHSSPKTLFESDLQTKMVLAIE